MTKWLTMQEASEQLGVSYKTIQRKVISKQLKSKKKCNIRLVYMVGLGQDKDTGSDNDQTKVGQKSDQKSTGETAFLQSMIKRQQDTIDEQGERLAELNKLVLGNQQTLARLTQTLQLQGGNLDISDANSPDIDRTVVGQATDKVSKEQVKDKTINDQPKVQVDDIIHQPTPKRASKATTVTNNQPAKEQKEEFKTIWQMIGGLWK